MEARTAVNLVLPWELSLCWDEHAPLLEVAITASENLFSDQDMKDNLADETWTLWDVSDDTGTVGCFVTEIIQVQQGLDLNVVLAGFKKNFKALHRALKELNRIAEASGFHAVRFISKDHRWGAMAERHGYRRRFIEYVKEL